MDNHVGFGRQNQLVLFYAPFQYWVHNLSSVGSIPSRLWIIYLQTVELQQSASLNFAWQPVWWIWVRECTFLLSFIERLICMVGLCQGKKNAIVHRRFKQESNNASFRLSRWKRGRRNWCLNAIWKMINLKKNNRDKKIKKLKNYLRKGRRFNVVKERSLKIDKTWLCILSKRSIRIPFLATCSKKKMDEERDY